MSPSTSDRVIAIVLGIDAAARRRFVSLVDSAALATLAALLERPDALAAAEHDVAALLGRILHDEPTAPTPPIEATLGRLALMPVTTLAEVEAAVAVLEQATTIGGPADPRLLGAELPWVRFVERLRGQPGLGLVVARRWYARLIELAFDSESGIDANGATVLAVYLAAALAVRAGRLAEARRWIEVGRAEAEADEMGAAELTVIVGAARIVLGDARH